MPEYQSTPYATFVDGLITEASKLGFPPNASSDEDNCELLKDGSRRRRLGIEFEDSYALSSENVNTNTRMSTHVWSNVGGRSGKEFIVVQVGNKLRFYEQGNVDTLSTKAVKESFSSSTDYVVNMGAFRSDYGNGAGSSRVQVASIKGALVVCSPDINSFYITRDTDTGAFTETEITFRIRDFEFIGDTSAYDTKSGTTPSIERQYDTLNCGWLATPAADPLTDYTTAEGGRYPPLTHPWYSAKDAAGAFDKSEWEELFTGNSLIVNGHYIYNLYTMNRSNKTGLTDVPRTIEESRFSTVIGYAGRAFFGGMKNSTRDNGTKVYFSRLLHNGFGDIGNCYQINDPTSEELNSLLDTDGGFISIPEMHELKQLHVFGSSLYIFATNGVWRVSGVDDVFRATEFSVSKISEDGIANTASFVVAQGRPYWWSYSGIHTLVANEVGDIIPTNISIGTIQTFWKNITASKRKSVRGIYDELNRRVVWIYQDVGVTNKIKKDKALIYDEVLQAFYPWSFSDQASNTNYIVDVVYQKGLSSEDVEYNVVDDDGNLVVDGSGNEVVITQDDSSLTDGKIKFLVVDGVNDKFTFAALANKDFLDWGDSNFVSFAETSYQFMNDLEMRKTQPYVTVYTQRTEEGWEENAEANGYDPIRESSLKVRAFWDFRTSSSSSAQQAYKYLRVPIADPADLSTFWSGRDVLTTRLKLRGRGRSVKLRFNSEQGKDFHLLGYNVLAQSPGRF